MKIQKLVSLDMRVTPKGLIRFEECSEEHLGMTTETAKNILSAFEESSASGLLHLALNETSSWLPNELSYWREMAKGFMSSVCGALDSYDGHLQTQPKWEDDDLKRFLQAAPPMQGVGFIDESFLRKLWQDMIDCLVARTKDQEGGIKAYLSHTVWNVVGRVCVHLAENKKNSDAPFAFMATYVHKISSHSKPQHLPLYSALKEYQSISQRSTLLTLLEPLSRAARTSELMRRLIDTNDIYRPLSWTPDLAYEFLCEVPLYEAAGLVVRLPGNWNKSRPPRPKVSVTVGENSPSLLGVNALLKFRVDMTLEGSPLSAEEIQQLLSANQSLTLIKGKWVEVDAESLAEVLKKWNQTQDQAFKEGVSFHEGLRWLAGFNQYHEGELEFNAGKWLRNQILSLKEGFGSEIEEDHAGLKTFLRPYQQRGVSWLRAVGKLGLGGCLADDMGLGKTIQVLGLLNLSRDDAKLDLLVLPASLLANWKEEFQRFAPELKIFIAHISQVSSAQLRKKPDLRKYDVVLSTYGAVTRIDWLKTHKWRYVILDEAQAIKNPNAKQTRAIKSLSSELRLALTGTPIENHLTDLWSLFDFLNPGLLGSFKTFKKFCNEMASHENGYAPLRNLLKIYILRRLKTDPSIISDLPEKTELTAHCLLSEKQVILYKAALKEFKENLAEKLDGIQRRGKVLSFLLRFKQICNHPDQWLGQGDYHPQDSGKFLYLQNLCETLLESQDKVLIFTQFRELTEPLVRFLSSVFGVQGLILHGGTPVKKRQALVHAFQEDDRIPFMVLSLKAGGTGLNLTAASHVIHFDRWWNPAVENQATDRAFRIGQKKNVFVHKFVCLGTLEERIDALIKHKQDLAGSVLGRGVESSFTEMSDHEILDLVSLDLSRALD
jgi:non-specific serine/threonine protein kinase